jgi:hypothetical protein
MGAASFGPTKAPAKGTKISAAPNPENPLESPAKSATMMMINKVAEETSGRRSIPLDSRKPESQPWMKKNQHNFEVGFPDHANVLMLDLSAILKTGELTWPVEICRRSAH